MSRPVSSLTLVACVTACAAPQRMRLGYMESAALRGRSVAYGVYTPPGWTPAEHLPLVVFLHGGGDNAHSLEEAGIPGRLDAAIEKGALPRVVVAAPDGDLGFWANWADGSRGYEDWVIREVMPVVARDYGTLPCPDGCHVIGISMGGNGALRFALHHPGLFASVSILSGPILSAEAMKAMVHQGLFRFIARLDRVFGSEPDPEQLWLSDPFQRWRSPADVAGLRIFFARGTQDRQGIAETSEAFEKHLIENHIPHRYLVFPGGHRWGDWAPVLLNAIRYGVARSDQP